MSRPVRYVTFKEFNEYKKEVTKLIRNSTKKKKVKTKTKPIVVVKKRKLKPVIQEQASL